MPKSKLTQIQVTGLATNPNPNGLPAGSCAIATNVVSRRPGVLTPCPTSTALATIDSINFTTGKGLWSDADNAVVAVLPQNVDDNAWVPGTDETQIGELVCYSVNQNDGATAKWELTQMPVGFNSSTGVASYRATGYIPGITHSAYSHFRTLFNEKWSQVVSDGTATGIDPSGFRWAGLMPPQMSAAVVSDSAGWLIDGNSAQYRAHYSIESTNTDKPFEVIGPVSTITPVYGVAALSVVNIGILISNGEPLVLNDAAYDVYVSVYRSTQAEVETQQELPQDFRLIAKRRVTIAEITSQTLTLQDRAIDAARDAGIPLYTNATEQGENGNSFAPPTARDIAVFRDTMFYANRASYPARAITIPGAYLSYTASSPLFSDEDKTQGIGRRVAGTNNTVTNGSAVVGITTPSNMLGLAVGQTAIVTVGGNTLTSTILTVGVSSITLANVWAFANSAAATVVTLDQYKMKIYFADGTTQTVTGDIVDHPNSVWRGFRIFGAWNSAYPLPAYGHTLIFANVYAARQRVLYFELALTNGRNYSPQYTGDYTTFTEPLVSIVDTRPNRLFFSKTGQPEEVPLLNYIDVGAGTLLKMAPTQSALLCLATDGLWRVTGEAAPWQVNQVDPTVTLLHPDCLNTLNNQIYGWVEDGLSLIGEDGAQTISTDAVGPDIREWATTIKNWGAPYFWGPSIMGDRFWNEIWLNIYRAHSAAAEFTSVTTLVYNTDTKNFTRLQRPFFSSLQYSPDANRMISQVFIPGAPANHIALTVQSDFYDPAGDGWLPVTVWFNALQTDDKGKLKQWMDVNYFVADVETTVGSDTSYLQALFDARNTSTDTLPYPNNTQSMVALSRDVHFWVPRRTALSDQQQLGLMSFVVDEDNEPDTTIGFNFQLQGFTVRYRVASDTLKR
jgi:hypothetical protein